MKAHEVLVSDSVFISFRAHLLKMVLTLTVACFHSLGNIWTVDLDTVLPEGTVDKVGIYILAIYIFKARAGLDTGNKYLYL